VRLTLRTLLAYLDDTLEPLEIKTIGQKVAESETAQELIARIKQVTRRRRITTPPATGPNAFDPNTVAEYLDNVLPPEQVAEVEKLCLESDVHLAEVASCHQILTLVLGEPAVVPPKAKERMYALVRGREAIPFRKATGSHASAPSSSEDADADEMFLLGLPFYRRGSWLRWALPLAAVLLFAIVGIALWQLIREQPGPSGPVVQNQKSSTEVATRPQPERNDERKAVPPENKNTPAGQPAAPSPTPPQPSPPPPPDPKQATPPAKTPQVVPSSPPGGAPAEAKTDTAPSTGKLEKAPASARETPPSNERVVIGQYRVSDFSLPSLLVQRKEKDGWVRLKPNSSVSTGDPLMSLPGYASEVRLDCGLHLLLRGHVREFTPLLLVKDQAGQERNDAALMDHLQECALVLHKPQGTNADLTLQRGRLYISNHKANDSHGLTVRLRFENKVWDVTLYPNAEVLVDLFKTHFPGTGEPLSALKLFLLKGEAGIALEHERYPDLSSEPGRAQFFWISLHPSAYERPYLSKQDLEVANRVLFPKRPTVDTPQARDMELALKTLRDRMTVDKLPESALQEALSTMGNTHFAEHQLALYCLAALDEVKALLDVLGKADAIYAPDRDTAIFALWRWLDHGKGQRERLFDPQTGKGLLPSELGYTAEESKRILDLLREPTDEEIFSPKFYMALARDLASDKVALAELARWWLSRLALGLFRLDLPKLKNFNAAMPQDRREAARREVEQAIGDGRLPPAESGKPRPPGGAPQLPRR